ncbi:uncharacterized protein LOC119190050 isoform X2 [Manduca sexta]|uniref:uncharacterized protein LOC119190050 isoform X2 n=1 Tax=Manduca sexta TaxID=7130 RepID=UPI00188EB276|nr:uncharacterized protein LOC119190050 isoform X2 [Manduca sexta]
MFVIIFFISIAGSTYGRRAAACIWLPTVTFSMKTAVRTRAASPGDAPGHTKKPSGVKSHCASGMVATADSVELESCGGQLLKIGGHWYRLDASYRNKRRWMCARGCGARLHTAGKRIVFSDARHRCRNKNNTI